MPRGFGAGAGMGGQGGFGCGRGFRGNPGVNCRFNPSLPRRWWAAGNQNPNAPVNAAWDSVDSGFLQRQAQFLRAQLGELERRLGLLEKKEPEQKE